VAQFQRQAYRSACSHRSFYPCLRECLAPDTIEGRYYKSESVVLLLSGFIHCEVTYSIFFEKFGLGGGWRHVSRGFNFLDKGLLRHYFINN
jgi:hypothetical protein